MVKTVLRISEFGYEVFEISGEYTYYDLVIPELKVAYFEVHEVHDNLDNDPLDVCIARIQNRSKNRRMFGEHFRAEEATKEIMDSYKVAKEMN